MRGRGGAGRRRRSRPFAHAASSIRLAEPDSRCGALAVGLVRLPCSPVGGRLLPPHVLRDDQGRGRSRRRRLRPGLSCVSRGVGARVRAPLRASAADSRFLDACGCAARPDGVSRYPHLPWNGQRDLSDEPLPPGGIAGDARAQPDAVEGGAARRSRALADVRVRGVDPRIGSAGVGRHRGCLAHRHARCLEARGRRRNGASCRLRRGAIRDFQHGPADD